MDLKQVLVIRKDLNMRKGKMVAQGAHASVMAVMGTPKAILNQWWSTGMTKVCVGCDSKEELLDLEKKAEEAGIVRALIHDAGRTEFHGEVTATALAIGPWLSEEIDKITGHLKLL